MAATKAAQMVARTVDYLVVMRAAPKDATVVGM
jgi:hypothetical protein